MVAIFSTPPTSLVQKPGTPDASFVEMVNGKPNQTTKTLISDPKTSDVLRIPNNAWLLRVAGTGQYTALVDMFVFQSGAQPVALKHAADNAVIVFTSGQSVSGASSAPNLK